MATQHVRDYYRSDFRSDLSRFMPESDLPYFGHSWNVNCAGLEGVPSVNRASFLSCLYFTVLTDQAMHCHFQPFYSRFEQLTRYPKFCHGLGQFQKNPRALLSRPVETGLVDKTELAQRLIPAMALYVEEVSDFFTREMTDVAPEEFLAKVAYDPHVQIPELVAILDPTIREDTVYIAYRALRTSIEVAFPSVL